MLGLKTVLPGRYVPEVLLELRGSEGVTFSHCVPTILQMLLRSRRLDQPGPVRLEDDHRRLDVPSRIVQGRWREGIDIFAGSGMSETGPIMTLAQMPPGVTPADATTTCGAVSPAVPCPWSTSG